MPLDQRHEAALQAVRLRPGAAAELEHVAKAARRDQADPRDLALEHRVGRRRRAVDDRLERARRRRRRRRARRGRRTPGCRPSSAPWRCFTSALASSTTIRSVKVPPTSMPAMRGVVTLRLAPRRCPRGGSPAQGGSALGSDAISYAQVVRAARRPSARPSLPSKLTSPFSRTTARSATSRAKCRFCSREQAPQTPSPLRRDDHARHLLDDQRRDAFRRLVEQHEVRIAHQRARDGQHLLLAAAHAAARPVGHRRRGWERARRACPRVHAGAPVARAAGARRRGSRAP